MSLFAFRKKITAALVSALLITAGLFTNGSVYSQSPSLMVDELKAPQVDFQNRSARFATAARRTIDNELGMKFAAAVINNKETASDHFRIRRIQNPEAPGYGADLIEILPTANIGHINVIQRILSGYLVKAFEFQESDAETLARFILYYNAFHRNRTQVIKEKYSEEVGKAVVPEKMGIDISYRNWPGKTMLVLPVKASLIRPGETDLDHGEVDRGSGAVTKEEQKLMDDLQQRRKEDDLKKLDQKQQELKTQEQQLKKEEQQLKQQQTENKKQETVTQTKIEEAKRTGNTTEQKKQEEVLKQQQTQTQQTEQKIEENKKAQEDNKETQTKVEEAKKDTESGTAASADAGKTQQENEQLKQENQQLATKVEELQQQTQKTISDKILFLRVVRNSSTGHFNNELWAIESESGDALKKSPFTNICSRDFSVVPNQGVLVAGYEGSFDREDEHRLFMLDPETLAVKFKSENRIFWDTPFIFQDGKIYVIEQFQGEYFLSRFSPDLKLEQRSSKPVHSHSVITFHKDKVYITGKPRTGDATPIVIFKKENLDHIKTIEPDALPK